jgi:high-affinity iron transporter
MKRPQERKYRKPMWIGALVAGLVTILTWVLAHAILQALAGYQEVLTTTVSLIAIIILLVILNWFFHKQYWTSWIANFHSKKQRLISGEAGLWLGLVTLGFTSVYREGFETVLFLQAFILENGMAIVLTGVIVALLLVALIGLVIFKMQVNLPYKNMLIITGVLVGGVLMQMVGNTVHMMQLIGWLPIHLIENVSLPYWFGTWFGLYPTWEGIGLQILSATYVIGSYYMAEYLQKRKTLVKETA